MLGRNKEFKIYINNNLFYIINKKKTIFQICLEFNQNIPIYCYHDKLSIAGNCRMCLVEIGNSIKPVVSCSKLVDFSVKQILLNSVLVRNIREGISQFLLYNHPLDCPICDQGGECDLQDQSMIYGTDHGRYFNNKRSVKEYYYGYFIKGVMTRCIHCTRCIRFLNEVAFKNHLGTVGRGNSTEVSMYLQENLYSFLSGNLIDLCPVGALTSKLFSYSYRNWELKSYYTYDIMDIYESNIRMDLNEFDICRILPVYNYSLNEEWISDRIRFSYDSYNKFKLQNPLLRDFNTNKLIKVSWNYLLVYLSNLFNKIQSKELYLKFNFFMGNILDLNTLIWVRNFFLLTNIKNQIYLNYEYNYFNNLNTSFREYFSLNIKLDFLKSICYGIFLNVNFDLESPVIFNKIRVKLNKKKFFGLIGNFFESFNNFGNHIGNTFLSYLLFSFGKHLCSVFLKLNHNKMVNIFVSKYIYNNISFISLVFVKKFLSNFYASNKILFHFLSVGLSDFSRDDLSIRNYFCYDVQEVQSFCVLKKRTFNINYIINANNKVSGMSKENFNIFQSNQLGLKQDYFLYDLYLPNLFSYEILFYYLNWEGDLKFINNINTNSNSLFRKESFKIIKFVYEIYLYHFFEKKRAVSFILNVKKMSSLFFNFFKKKVQIYFVSNKLNYLMLSSKILNFKINNLYLNVLVINRILYFSSLNKFNNLLINYK